MVEQKTTTQGIKMSKGVESILVSKQEIVVSPKLKPTVVEGVHVVIKVKDSEPKHKQQNGNIVRRVPRD